MARVEEEGIRRSYSMADSRTAYELKDIPLLKSIIGIYTRTKSSSAILTAGCSVAEKSIEFVVETIVETAGCGDTVDAVASNLISRVKETYPILQKTPEKIYKKTKIRTSRFVRKRAKSALKTCIGQTILSTIDALTETSATAYKHLKYNNTGSKRDRSMRSTSKSSEKHVQTDLVSPTKTSRGQQTKLTGGEDQWVKKLIHEDEQRVERAFTISSIILVPLGLFIQFLRFLQRKLHSLEDRHSEIRRSNRKRIEAPPLTPEKIEEIESRRKVSPRKRLNSSIFRNIKSAAFKMLGFDTSCVKQTDIRQFLNCSKHRPLNLSPVMSGDDTEKKRKHEDIESDSEPESDDEDLVNMDLKDYISDEDPDYEPTDEEDSDLSIESEDEEEESDLETVESDGLIMLKDKENRKPSESKPKEEEIKLKPKEPDNKSKPKEQEDKTKDKNKMNESSNEKQKEKSPTKKYVLSPKKQPNTNVPTPLIINKSPQKPFTGKDEKKDSNQKTGSSVDQGHSKQSVSETGSKQSTNQTSGSYEKQQQGKRS